MKLNNKYLSIIIVFIMVMSAAASYAQKADTKQAKKALRAGNESYRKNQAAQADSLYARALAADPNYYKALYNQGNARYRLEKNEEARKTYEKVLQHKSLTKEETAMVHHNIGNTYLKENKYDEAIEAYKKSLRLNPYNYDTKYNLAYAQRKKNNGGGGGDNDKDKQNQDKQEQQEQKKRDKMTQEEAEAILNAMRQDERALQDKKNKEQGIPMPNPKDW